MMELNLNRVDFCQVSTTSQKCMHLLPPASRKDPLQKVSITTWWSCCRDTENTHCCNIVRYMWSGFAAVNVVFATSLYAFQSSKVRYIWYTWIKCWSTQVPAGATPTTNISVFLSVADFDRRSIRSASAIQHEEAGAGGKAVISVSVSDNHLEGAAVSLLV